MQLRIKNEKLFLEYTAALGSFSGSCQLTGLTSTIRREMLVAQIIDSVRRIEYLRLVAARAKSSALHTPYSGSFEPFGGAVVLNSAGKIDDAYWLLYLATHFGKHKDDGWNLTEDFYGRFGQGGVWDWTSAKQDPLAIAEWLGTIYPVGTTSGRSRRFGNHRKFETLKPGTKGTGHALSTYISWINRFGSHQAMIASTQKSVGQNPQAVFAYLYKSLSKVAKLGRLGKFDLLCNWSNLMIAPIFPDKSYISGSTGPRAGAALLFGGNCTVAKLDACCSELSDHLQVSPQVIEDSLCNWQKSPEKYVFFRG